MPTSRRMSPIFPLAIPLLTGPGAITTVVVLMSAAASLTEKALVILALILYLRGGLRHPQVLRVHRPGLGDHRHHGHHQDHGADPGGGGGELCGRGSVESVPGTSGRLKIKQRLLLLRLLAFVLKAEQSALLLPWAIPVLRDFP